MRIAIIHTVGSPCRCAEALAGGLIALGHEPLLVNSEEVEFHASSLAGSCDLVIDHTDTYHGKGLFRPLVRLLLEAKGARIVGSSAHACLAADDKAGAKRRLAAAGIPTPPGIIVASQEFTVPEWLTPPFVIKTAFEHMSRCISRVSTVKEASRQALKLLDDLSQPVIIERYIPGRELAVSVLDGPEGLEVLPPLEWLTEDRGSFLTEEFKLQEQTADSKNSLQSELPANLADMLRPLAKLAFETLGLRDYARFDVRLSPAGTFFFLEANTTPSLEPYEAMATSAGWAGMSYPELVNRMLNSALKRYKGKPLQKNTLLAIGLSTGPVEIETPDGIHPPTPSSIALAQILDIRPGENVLDLGCGSGILSIAAAKLGAGIVISTDLNPEALDATLANALRNNVEKTVRVAAGSWYETLDTPLFASIGINKFDVIIATPPQTPGPRPFGPRYGGQDGTEHIFSVIEGVGRFLKPESGRMWLIAISLANTRAVLDRLRSFFYEVDVVKETERNFTREEYEALEPGLFDHFLGLREKGVADFKEVGHGGYIFRNLFIRSGKLRPL